MDNITASEVAGLGVGAVLLSATLAATKVDAFFSSSQRSSLGMCKRCGNLKRLACSTCRGTGSIREGGILGLQHLFQTLGNSESNVNLTACVKCQAKGYSPCPLCSQL
ncbi:unnamed protein product [Sphenostylis stenocarpa]|uniref:Uncharacterized protein n=1 Tax=Sphenostylis stenocarpa TaxID=92480 RepID=A0AA86S8G2_9FABA|nr:unnamed protein product [Sphenostylis stenocarpa]CAJ1947206.1 unnamed protein product [Sphenostylis stenocarpa]